MPGSPHQSVRTEGKLSTSRYHSDISYLSVLYKHSKNLLTISFFSLAYHIGLSKDQLLPTGMITASSNINVWVSMCFLPWLWPVYGLQDTPASSMWSQLCCSQRLWGHSSRQSSLPVHWTPSSKMGPKPWPKWAHVHALATPLLVITNKHHLLCVAQGQLHPNNVQESYIFILITWGWMLFGPMCTSYCMQIRILYFTQYVVAPGDPTPALWAY